MEKVLSKNKIIGSNRMKVFAATSANEAAAVLGVDLLTNFVGTVRCVVQTLALFVRAVFKIDNSWKRYLNPVNNILSYLNQPKNK